MGFLLFVQVNNSLTNAVQQLGYPELLPGGVFYDFEQALMWMRNNLPGTSVVVSWWDYGYWITIVGNMTSVNDNATWNATRIGEVGLAMMSTDPRYSAEIFKDMHADYVLVFFGHLYSGLGGDEGKWQWMLRICNDYTQDYLNSGFLDKNLWYGQGTQKVNTVYDEADYINDSSGLYEPAWFQSTVVQMMFDKDPTTLSDVPQNNQVEAYYAAQIAGDAAQNIQQRTLDNGQPWANYIPTDGNYQFTYWQPAFFSSNNLVKIYKMDYNALDAQVNIDNTNLDTNGVGSVNITNTGTIPIMCKVLVLLVLKRIMLLPLLITLFRTPTMRFNQMNLDTFVLIPTAHGVILTLIL